MLHSYLLLLLAFLPTLQSFSCMAATTRLWSLETSAPLYDLVSNTDRLNMNSLPHGQSDYVCAHQVMSKYTCEYLCGNYVVVITRLFVAQNSTNCSPLSFLTHFRASFPITLSSPTCLSPTLAFQFPISIKMSCFGTLSRTF